jgi:single-strand DNA-binding protein
MNSITLVGNVTKDAEIRYTQGGDAILGFSVADNQGKDKPALYWNCSLFGKRAESLAPFIVKGGKVTVVGTISEDQYTDKNGNDKKSMKVRVSDIALQGGKEQTEEKPARQAKPQADLTEDDGSDIPF